MWNIGHAMNGEDQNSSVKKSLRDDGDGSNILCAPSKFMKFEDEIDLELFGNPKCDTPEFRILLRRIFLRQEAKQKELKNTIAELNLKCDGLIADQRDVVIEKRSYEEKLEKYESILYLRMLIDSIESEVSSFRESDYKDKMKKLYTDADSRELVIKNHHYMRMQYILNFASPAMDNRISVLRTFFDTRDKKHEFSLHVKSAYKLFSKDIHENITLLANKSFTTTEIRQSLNKLVKFSRKQISNLCRFAEIMTENVDTDSTQPARNSKPGISSDGSGFSLSVSEFPDISNSSRNTTRVRISNHRMAESSETDILIQAANVVQIETTSSKSSTTSVVINSNPVGVPSYSDMLSNRLKTPSKGAGKKTKPGRKSKLTFKPFPV